MYVSDTFLFKSGAMIFDFDVVFEGIVEYKGDIFVEIEEQVKIARIKFFRRTELFAEIEIDQIPEALQEQVSELSYLIRFEIDCFAETVKTKIYDESYIYRLLTEMYDSVQKHKLY